MTTQRLAPSQILTVLSLDAAREATWRAFAGANLSDVVIDRAKNVVVGSSGAKWNSNGETITASFEEKVGGTVIDVAAKSHFGGKFDARRMRKRAQKLADAVVTALERPAPLQASPTAPAGFGSVLPIAAPTGESSYALGAPVYGPVMPAKRGSMIMLYAVLGLVFVHILSPFAWIYAHKTLKDYGDLDPGDKKQVKIARIIGIIGTVLLLGIWGLQFYLASR